MKKTVSLLAALLLVCVSIPWTAAASDVSIQPMWIHIRNINGAIDIKNSVATVSGDALARASTVEKVNLTVSLQQKGTGSWTEIKSWTVNSTTTSATLTDRSWPVPHGYSYRVVVTAKAMKGMQVLETGSHTVNYGYYP